jgi:hypothetical protein
MALDDETKKRIDDWIKHSGRNSFGDPPGTVYAGGNPLFDEMRPGPMLDRYEYVLSRHPELKSADGAPTNGAKP